MTLADMPRVTFVVAAFNAAKTIDATLDCLVSQEVDDWEAVIVDDGSTDQTANRVLARARVDNRFRLIQQTNAGASSARNTGIAAALGHWLTFLDSDDLITPEFLAKLLPMVDANDDRRIAFCSYVRVTASGIQLPADYCEALIDDPYAILARQCEPAIHCVLIAKALVSEVGGFDPTLSNCEDWDLWLKVARSGGHFHGTPDAMAVYCMRPGSLSGQHDATERNARTVLNRACNADPRVPYPDPKYALGLIVGPSGSGAIISAAAILAAGRRLPENWASDLDAPRLNQLLDDPVTLLSAALATLPPDIDARQARTLFSQIEYEIDRKHPGSGTVWADTIAWWFAHPATAATASVQVGRWLALRLPLDAPVQSIVPPDDVSMVKIFLVDDKDIPSIEMMALAPLAADEIADALVEQLSGARLLRLTRGLSRMRWWLGLVHGIAPAMLNGYGIRGRMLLCLKAATRFAMVAKHSGEARTNRIFASAIAASAAEEAPSLKNEISAPAINALAPKLYRPGEIPILLFPTVTIKRARHSDSTLGVLQLAEILSLLHAEGMTPVPLAELVRLRGGQSTGVKRPVFLIFDDVEGEFDRLCAPMLQDAGMVAEVLVSSDSLHLQEWEARRTALIGKGYGIGFRTTMTPIGPAARIEQAATARALIRLSPSVAYAGYGLSRRQELAYAGYDLTIVPGEKFASVRSKGGLLSAMECSGAEAIGQIAEYLRV